MKVTEQIDALKTLSTNPFNYLIVPRILAGLISLPFLVFIGDIIGVFGGYLICTQVLNFNPTVYLQNTFNFVQFLDVFSGLVKACVFGFIITFMGCYHGFQCKGVRSRCWYVHNILCSIIININSTNKLYINIIVF